MPTVNIPPFGDIEVSEQIMQQYTPDQFRQLLVEDAAAYAEENNIDIDSFSRQFGKEVTSTVRGITEAVTGERTTNARDDFLAEVAIAKDPIRGYSGMVAGALLDPVTLPAAFLKLFKLGRIGSSALAGAFGGGAGAVREEYGEDRLTNAAFGAAAGGVLGAGVEVLMRRFGVDSPEALQKLYDEGGDAVKKEIEDSLGTLGDEIDLKLTKQTEDTVPFETPTARAETPEPVARAAEAQARAEDPVRIDAEIQRNRIAQQEYDARIQQGVKQLEEDVATIPSRGVVKKFEAQVKNVTNDIGKLTNKIDNLTKARDALVKSKVAPKAKRAKVNQLEKEMERLTLDRDSMQSSLDKREGRMLGEINALKDKRTELNDYYNKGILPPSVQSQVGEAPRLTQRQPRDESYIPTQGRTEPVPVTSNVSTQMAIPNGGMMQMPEMSVTTPARPLNIQPRQVAPEAPQAPSQAVPTTGSATPQGVVEAPTEFKRAGAVDRVLGAISTRLRDAFPTVFQGMRNLESETNRLTNIPINKSKPFFDQLKRLRPEAQDIIKGYLYNGKFDKAAELMNPEMRKAFTVINKELRNMRKLANDAGMNISFIENYFPRSVKDVEGLRKALGRGPAKSEMDRVLEEYRTKNGVSVIPPEIEVDLLNKVVRGIRRKKQVQLGAEGKRTLDTVPEELLQFYDDPATSLTRYFQKMGRDIPVNNFMGKHAVRDTEGNLILEGSDGSIGKLLADMRMKGNLDAEAEAELLNILSARFIQGEKGMNKVLAAGRDLGYIGTIGNIASAIVNLGDLGSSAALHGFTDTVRSMFGKAAGNKYDVVDMGIDHTIANELRDNKTTARWLNTVFKVSQFQNLDRLAKNTSMNAAMRKNEALAKSDKGKAKLRQKWGAAYGDEVEVLIRDLEQGQVTPRTKLLAFHELSDMQPISLSEASEYYLNNPDMRLFYMLKSFTLKQYDVLRREVVREYAKGNKMEAVKKATALLGYMTAANVGVQTVKDFALGRDIEPEELPNKALWTMLGIYGLNNYMIDRYIKQGDISGAVQATVFPPLTVFDSAGKLVKEASKAMDDEEYNLAKASRALPVIGPIIYSHFGGGAENFNSRQEVAIWNKKLESMGYGVE